MQRNKGEEKNEVNPKAYLLYLPPAHLPSMVFKPSAKNVKFLNCLDNEKGTRAMVKNKITKNTS